LIEDESFYRPEESDVRETGSLIDFEIENTVLQIYSIP